MTRLTRTKQTAAGIVLMLIGTLALSAFGVNHIARAASTLTVCPSGPPGCGYASINAAIAAASSGDTIMIAAGTYNEHVVVNKDNLTIQGAGAGSTIIQNTSSPGTGVGILFSGGLSAITIKSLSVTGFLDGIETPTGPMSNVLFQDLSSSGNARHGYWCQAFGVTNLTLLRVTASNNGTSGNAGRGFWIIDGTKSGVTVQDGTFNTNGLVGIDLSDGSVTGTSITGNTVVGNGDSGIAVLGAQGPDANLISGNTVTNNGRYGIEIKVPNGSGATSGAGSIVVANNAVSRTVAATDARDYAGIAVIRRSVVTPPNADQPTGVVISGNSVQGYHRKPSGSTGDGFGIVVEGTNHQVTNNRVVDNDVGIQVQGGNTANVQGTDYFDRGDATNGTATITSNLVRANTTVGIRAVTLATNPSPMITARTNCIVGNTPLGAKNDLATGGATFDAAQNWWGAASGPNNATSNASGTGNGASDNVVFAPFLTQPAAPCAPPVITITTPHNGTAYDQTGSLVIAFAVAAGSAPVDTSTVHATLDTTVVSNGQTITLSTLALGSHSFTVSASDTDGNMATLTITFDVAVNGLSGAAVGAQPVSPHGPGDGPTGGVVTDNGTAQTGAHAASSSDGSTATVARRAAAPTQGAGALLQLVLLVLGLLALAGGAALVLLRRRSVLNR